MITKKKSATWKRRAGIIASVLLVSGVNVLLVFELPLMIRRTHTVYYPGYTEWVQAAKAAVPSGNHLELTNPSTTDTFQVDVRVGKPGEEVWVWWDDGNEYTRYYANAQLDTTVSYTYSAARNRKIMIFGDITRMVSNHTDGRTAFGGAISMMRSLEHLHVTGTNTLSGDISGLTRLNHLYLAGSNTVSGDVRDLENLTTLFLSGANALGGDVSKLKELTSIHLTGRNTISGDIGCLTLLRRLTVGGRNSLTGDVCGLSSLSSFNVSGNNTLSGNVTGMTALRSLVARGNNTISGDIGGLIEMETLILEGANTVTGKVANLPLQILRASGFSTLAPSSIAALTRNSTELSHLFLESHYLLNQEQVDAILANIWENRDAPKPRKDRLIDIRAADSSSAPSENGMTLKNKLENYQSPNHTGPDVWKVLTR